MGGVPKLPVAGARVTTFGIEGDAHRDTEHHGGPERAVCLYARGLAPRAIRPGDGVRLLTETEAAALPGAART